MTELMAGFARYPAYKDSGVEWIGEIPEHWEILANKYIFKLKKNQVGKRSNEYDLLSLTLKGIIKRDMENPEGKFPAEFDTYQEVRVGDFVFCLFDVEETPRTVGVSSFDGMITGAYTVMEHSSKFNRNFLYYFYLNLDDKKRLKPLYKGLRNTIPKDNFFSFKTFIPPLIEQTAIANFLDEKTAKIDQAIAQKERLIALLRSRKQVIIQTAVTKGLDSSVPFKDSGVAWIGEIPAGWGVKRLRHLGQTQNGISAGGDYFGEGFPFVSYGDVYKNIELPKTVTGLAKSTKEDQSSYSVKKGDIFFTRTSETVEEIGFSSTCLETIPNATFAGFLIRFRPRTGVLDPRFSKYYFSSKLHRAFFVKEMNLVIRASLSQELLKKLPVILPPLAEQQAIAAHIEAESAKIDEAIGLQARQIERLRVYRATLINSAVTGKIRVG